MEEDLCCMIPQIHGRWLKKYYYEGQKVLIEIFGTFNGYPNM